MKTVVLYVHPWDGSFNHYVLDEVLALLKRDQKEVDLIDLYKDRFNPTMMPSDLRLFGRGDYNDPLAEDYVNRLKNAHELIMIFPIWWYGEPAMLKGFYDKVFLKNHTYIQEGYEVKPVLNITKTTILTTGQMDENNLHDIGDPIKNRLAINTLEYVGIKNAHWIHCGNVYNEENRLQYLNKIKDHLLRSN